MDVDAEVGKPADKEEVKEEAKRGRGASVKLAADEVGKKRVRKPSEKMRDEPVPFALRRSSAFVPPHMGACARCCDVT